MHEGVLVANDPYAEFTSDLTPSSADPYAEFTSDLPPSQPSFLDKAKIGANIFGLVNEELPWNKIKEATFGKAGEKVAELGGKLGYPILGAELGTGVSMIPDTSSALMGFEGIENLENPIAKGLLNTPKELSPEYDALLENPELNISKRTPELGGSKATFPNPYNQTVSTKPPLAIQTETAYPTNLRGAEPLPSTVPLKYPGQADNPRAFINFANSRIQAFGDKLSPQEVTDYGKIISQYYKDGVFPKGSPLAADGGKLSSLVDTLQNKLIDGKQALDTAYGISKVQDAVTKFLIKAPLYAGELGFGGYFLKKGLNYLRGNQ